MDCTYSRDRWHKDLYKHFSTEISWKSGYLEDSERDDDSINMFGFTAQKMEAVSTSETLANFHHTTRENIPEVGQLTFKPSSNFMYHLL
jgi:hypothetical protein